MKNQRAGKSNRRSKVISLTSATFIILAIAGAIALTVGLSETKPALPGVFVSQPTEHCLGIESPYRLCFKP